MEAVKRPPRQQLNVLVDPHHLQTLDRLLPDLRCENRSQAIRRLIEDAALRYATIEA